MAITKRFEFKYAGSDVGFCQTFFERQRFNQNCEPITSRYCITIPEGAFVVSTWDEPLSAFNPNILKFCHFQEVPSNDAISTEINAWIKNNTAGLLPTDHSFKIHPYKKG